MSRRRFQDEDEETARRPQTVNANLGDAQSAATLGYHTFSRAMDGSIESAVGPNGQRVTFVGGRSPEQAASEQIRANLPGTGQNQLGSGSGGGRGVFLSSSAGRVLDRAPTAKPSTAAAPADPAASSGNTPAAAPATRATPATPGNDFTTPRALTLGGQAVTATPAANGGGNASPAGSPLARPVARPTAPASNEPTPEMHDMMVQWAHGQQADGSPSAPTTFKDFGAATSIPAVPVGTGPQQASQRAVAAADQATTFTRPFGYGPTGPSTPVPRAPDTNLTGTTAVPYQDPKTGQTQVGYATVGAVNPNGPGDGTSGIYVNGKPAAHGADDAKGRPTLYDPTTPTFVTRPPPPPAPVASTTAGGIYDFGFHKAVVAPPLAPAGQTAYVPPAGPPSVAPAPTSPGSRAAQAVQAGASDAVGSVRNTAGGAIDCATGAVGSALGNASDFVTTLAGGTPATPQQHQDAAGQSVDDYMERNPAAAAAARPPTTSTPAPNMAGGYDLNAYPKAAPAPAPAAPNPATSTPILGANTVPATPANLPGAGQNRLGSTAGSGLGGGSSLDVATPTVPGGPTTPNARPSQGPTSGGSLDAATPTVAGGPTTPNAKPAQGLTSGGGLDATTPTVPGTSNFFAPLALPGAPAPAVNPDDDPLKKLRAAFSFARAAA